MQCGDMRLHLDKLQEGHSCCNRLHSPPARVLMAPDGQYMILPRAKFEELELCGQKRGRFGYRGKLSDDVAAGQVSSRTANQLAGLGAEKKGRNYRDA